MDGVNTHNKQKLAGAATMMFEYEVKGCSNKSDQAGNVRHPLSLVHPTFTPSLNHNAAKRGK